MPSNRPIRNPYKRILSNPRPPSLTSSHGTSMSSTSTAEARSLSNNVLAHTGQGPACADSPHGAHLRSSSSSTATSSTPPSIPATNTTTRSSGSASSPISVDGDSFSQIPVAETAFYDVVTTPEKGSPSRDDLRSNLDAERASRKNDGRCLLDELAKMHKKQKKRMSPKNEICTFLRETLVNQRFNDFKSGKRTPGISSKIRNCMRNWNTDVSPVCADEVDSELFDDSTKDAMCGGGVSLGYEFGRLWLEDFVLLKPGDKVTMLVSSEHRFFKEGGKRVTLSLGLNKSRVTAMMRANPLRPVRIGNTVYYALAMEVKSNAKRYDFENSNLDRAEASRALSVDQGGGVTFACNALDGNGNEYHHMFTVFYASLLVDPLEMMFWMAGNSAGTRISSFKRTLDKMTDHLRMHALVDVLKDYVYGDRLQSYAMYSHLSSRLAKKEKDSEIVKYKNAEISDSRLKKHLSLKAGNEQLRAFVSFVDSSCLNAIDRLYGRFSTYSSPILSQDVLNCFVSKFKTLLPTQYKAITCL